jgi:GNAT superfamily N-acetyltransferase
MVDWDRVNAQIEAVFGEQAQYAPAIGLPFPIGVTFHQAYKSLDFADGVGVSSESPAIGVRLTEFQTQPKQGDRVTITATNLHDGGIYVVKDVRRNGVGAAILLLNKVNS